MQITIATPEYSDFIVTDVKSDASEISFVQKGQYIVVSVTSEENRKISVEVFF